MEREKTIERESREKERWEKGVEREGGRRERERERQRRERGRREKRREWREMGRERERGDDCFRITGGFMFLLCLPAFNSPAFY